MKKNSRLSPETIAAQAAGQIDEKTGSVIPPIQMATTYARDENYERREDLIYARYGTPTCGQAENVLAKLEEAEDALFFNSGLSAAAAVLESLPAGAHIVVPENMYFGVLVWMQRQADKGYLSLDTYVPADLDSLESAMRDDTALIWVETPTNPTWAVTDIAAVSKIAKAKGALVLVDSTTAPPCTTKPLNLGADYAFHSATKYLNGHSDVLAGALSTNLIDDRWEDIGVVRKLQGTALPGFEAWLVMRGMRTLYVRWNKACENAIKIAKHFNDHPLVERVQYPGLPNDPGHAIAQKQMTGGFGGMMSILVKGSEQAARNVARNTELFLPATSLGGVESLIEHRFTIEGPDYGVAENLLRLSVGIEDADDLIADLEQAITRACG
ncbi:PLP-dependent transferase [Amylibacter sp. SFDW26]|uniref:trans-sulfuration enzyme family protein n=1 Tax=Amylibacter sp. SFDW26 TaxID=2652722 RepID=UPI0012616964|nr:PLP-dependent aspartate aminotransferase family protein [Amylibacter sp. SFDW26]KAB7616335.1 PLP-dependent transferase [Amylibacter sp. SFDW26]